MKKIFSLRFAAILLLIFGSSQKSFGWYDEYGSRSNRNSRRRQTQRTQKRCTGDRRALCNRCCAEGEWVTQECLDNCNRCFERNDSAVTAGRYWPHA